MMTVLAIICGCALIDLATTWRRNRVNKYVLAEILAIVDETQVENHAEIERVRQLDGLAGLLKDLDPAAHCPRCARSSQDIDDAIRAMENPGTNRVIP